ncbi:alpha/beta hydrolase fold domain-containing protein [Amnibacterium kyonggiense]|uniref:Acetyl esterase/lipase n=1 Tax=Amnibacterium kyonggiense TaxID=595671 RepID=A0A4R7FIX3_9MICO|nr:alpha/beta hydrolase fold domain-containing protein [Amnibacterium kyonggiense]TDS74932.1 acetyl esterase/lipase [Amnibacterium kyonggiense]
MPVHPLIAARFPLIADVAPGTPSELLPETALQFGAPYGEHTPPAVSVTETTIDGPHGPIRLRVYRSDELEDAGAGAHAVLWAHGGGFTAGDLDMPEAHVVGLELAHRLRGVVVSVDYRLATETVRHPIPVDDVAAAWAWLLASADDLGIDPTRAAIGGASAGAFLASAATLRTSGADRPAAVLLAYPALHFPNPASEDALAAELRTLPPVLRFFPQVVVAIFQAYLGRITDIPSAETPGLADLTGYPPVRIVVSEYDDLRSSGELFAQQLASSGVPVELTVAEGMLHGHLNIPPVDAMPEIARSLDFLAGS